MELLDQFPEDYDIFDVVIKKPRPDISEQKKKGEITYPHSKI